MQRTEFNVKVEVSVLGGCAGCQSVGIAQQEVADRVPQDFQGNRRHSMQRCLQTEVFFLGTHAL